MAFLIQLGPEAPLFSPSEHWANLILGAVALAAICWLSLRTCQLLTIDLAASHRALLALVFGTGLFHYATYDACFSHVYSALGASLLLWLGVRVVVLGQGRPDRLAMALTCFFLILIRNTNVILIAVLALAYVGWRKEQGIVASLRRLTAAFLGAGVGAALQLGINWYYHGRPALSSYGSEPFLWNRPMQWSVLFSCERGLFSYYPVLAVVLTAAWLVRRTRLMAGCFTVLVLAYATLYGFWWSWMLGGGFGHRGFVELMPLAIVLFAAALGEMTALWRKVVCQAALVATIVTLQFMIAYWRGGLPCMGATEALYWRYGTRGLCIGISVAVCLSPVWPWLRARWSAKLTLPSLTRIPSEQPARNAA
jgi:hypothetical protein